MTFTREQKKQAYEKLSPEVQDFVMSNETTELIGKLLRESGLSEDEEISADSEILYSLYGLQPLSIAIENIAKLSNRNLDNLSNLKMKLEDNVFGKIPQQKEADGVSVQKSTQQPTIPQPPKPEQPRSRIAPVGFEEAILNQVRAMRVATPPPSNLPTAPEHNVHDYKQGADPYREPTE